ncbi:MAG: hypothetical protein RL240_3920, partial [Planctomycetota bacterium]
HLKNLSEKISPKKPRKTNALVSASPGLSQSREFTVTGLLAQLRYSYRAACFGRCVLVHIREKFRWPSGPQSIQNGEHIDDFLKDRPGDRVQ